MMHLNVAVAAIRDDQNRLLISKRHEHLHQGGLWEFPGGKIEAGETIHQALVREIHEELGVDILDGRLLLTIPHQYPDRSVCLHVWLVETFSGNPLGKEGQQIRWVEQSELNQYAFPAANRTIVSALQLPDQYLITPHKNTVSELLDYLAGPIRNGVELIQFRAPQWDQIRYQEAALEIVEYCHSMNVRVVLNAESSIMEAVDADGIHLNGERLAALTERPIGPDKWLSASCHNLEEIKQAHRLEVDYISLSPVLPTASHPGKAELGWQKFAELVDQATMPVFALGGMGFSDIELAINAGGQGIAGISLFS